MQLLEEILNIIKEEGISIAKFSKQCGLDERRMSNWKYGNGKPKQEDYVKLSNWLENYKGITTEKEVYSNDSFNTLISSNNKLITTNAKLVDTIHNMANSTSDTNSGSLVLEQQRMLLVYKHFLHDYVIGKTMKESEVLSILDTIRHDLMGETAKVYKTDRDISGI